MARAGARGAQSPTAGAPFGFSTYQARQAGPKAGRSRARSMPRALRRVARRRCDAEGTARLSMTCLSNCDI
eukprot:2893886-Pyramimonas_sp.AAC.1